MFLRAFGGIMVFICCLSLGDMAGKDLTLRMKELVELRQMIEFLNGELQFHQALLYECFEAISLRVSAPFSDFCKNMAYELQANTGEKFTNLWQAQTNVLMEESHLHKCDRECMDRLGAGIGYLDLNMQSKTIKLCLYELEEHITQARIEMQQKVKLLKLLGAAAGIFIIIIVI